MITVSAGEQSVCFLALHSYKMQQTPGDFISVVVLIVRLCIYGLITEWDYWALAQWPDPLFELSVCSCFVSLSICGSFLL